MTEAQRAPTAPKPVSRLNAEYIPARWTGKDTSGIRCVGVYVLVLMDTVAEQTAGGAYLTLDHQERLQMAAESGILVAVGGSAFRLNDDGSEWSGVKPLPGDHIQVEQYAGKQVRGRDGQIYRLMTYGNVGAVYEPIPDADEAAA